MSRSSGILRFVLGVLFISNICFVVFGLFSPVLAIDCWKDENNVPFIGQPSTILECCDKTSILAGLLPGKTYGGMDRWNRCIATCTSGVEAKWYSNEASAKDYENFCCNLTPPLGITVGDSQASLKAKCDIAAQHTGKSSSCLINSDGRPDGVKDCCVKEKNDQATIVQDINGKLCPTTVYEGSDTCRKDNIFSCCICKSAKDASDAPTRVRIGAANGGEYNCQTCSAACASASGLADGVPDFSILPIKAANCSGVASASAPESGAAGGSSQGGGSQKRKFRQYEAQDMFCFTQAECAEAAGSVENFKPGNGCPNKGKSVRGYCRAPEPNWLLQNPIGGVTNITGLRNLIGLLFNVGIGFLVIAASAMFVWGAFKYMVSGVSSQISSGKDTMIDAVAGMALGLGAYAILTNVAPNTLQFKPYDLNMINRTSFFNVVMCKSITPLEQQKFGFAGEPEDPRAFSDMMSKEGFDKTFKQTQCGSEYFIEGSDSQAVCKGETCPSGGICVNCASGIAISCTTRSANEFKCADCKIGGNVLTAKRWVPNNSWAYLFCSVPKGNDLDIDVEELSKTTIPHDDPKNLISSASASGWVSNICMKKFNMTAEAVKKFGKDCQAKGGKSGMLLLHFVDKELTSDLSGVQSIREDMRNPGEYFLRSAGYVVGAIPAALSAFYDSNADNAYLFATKTMCEKNLYGLSMPFKQGFWAGNFTGEAAVLEDGFVKFYQDPVMRKFYDQLVKEAWTTDEAAAIIESGMTDGCGFSYSP